MTKAKPNLWTEADDAYLRKWWRESNTVSEIGLNLPGGPRSKNSVISRAHRIGLGSKRDLNNFRYVDKKPEEPSEAICNIVPFSLKTCQFPFGDPRGNNFRYCGEPTDGGSWCPDCRKIVFVPMGNEQAIA